MFDLIMIQKWISSPFLYAIHPSSPFMVAWWSNDHFFVYNFIQTREQEQSSNVLTWLDEVRNFKSHGMPNENNEKKDNCFLAFQW